MRLLSWNVNGVRAVTKKGFAEIVAGLDADVLCIQETKAMPEQVPEEIRTLPDYPEIAFHSAERKGYSGVATFVHNSWAPKVAAVTRGFGVEEFDVEGRVLVHDFGAFLLYNIYFPNGTRGEERLQYKYRFYETLLGQLQDLMAQGREIVICGDFNIAHTAVDLAHPKPNEKRSGFLPEERAWLDRYLAAGFVDTFRHLHPDVPERYSWWDYRFRSRDRNVGWRIDYFYITRGLLGALEEATIRDDVFGSDHCPVGITLRL